MSGFIQSGRFSSAAPLTEYTIFGDGTPSGVTNAGVGGTGYTLGVRWSSSVDGVVRGIRFWKNNTTAFGVDPIGKLWLASDGSQLATVTLTSEPATTGWHRADFASPVAVTAGTFYVASIFLASTDFYPKAQSWPVTLGVLTASGGGTNGRYASGDAYPSSVADNYLADVVFAA